MRIFIHITIVIVALFSFHYVHAAPIRILVVPGHDDQSFGTSYRGIKEADLTLELGQKLFNVFSDDPYFEAYLARTSFGYAPEVASYFDANTDAINEYRAYVKARGAQARASGAITAIDGVNHNSASESVSFKLYGINKWANDHAIDLVIHVHFNDVPRYDTSVPGDYTGFTIYAPDMQYANGWKSQEISAKMYDRLSQHFATSNLNKENAGIVPEQELIAIGANDSLFSKSVLVEYGYIYESQNTDPAIRPLIFQKMADETYAGVKEYFSGKIVTTKNSLVPNKFTIDLEKGMQSNPSVLALQSALMSLGIYPAGEITRNDCPLSGKFGPCTEAAVKAFQRKYGISPIGRVGPATRAKLNTVYFKN